MVSYSVGGYASTETVLKSWLKHFIENENKIREVLGDDFLLTKIRTDNNIRKTQDESKTIFENKNTKREKEKWQKKEKLTY